MHTIIELNLSIKLNFELLPATVSCTMQSLFYHSFFYSFYLFFVCFLRMSTSTDLDVYILFALSQLHVILNCNEKHLIFIVVVEHPLKSTYFFLFSGREPAV